MKLAALRPTIRFEKKWPEIIASLLHALVFILGGMLLARWIWLLFSPTVLIMPPASEQAASSQSSTILAAHWFTPKNGGIAIAAPSTVNFKLVGIYAATASNIGNSKTGDSKQGFAVFKLADGKQKSVLIHQEITAGIALQAIKQEAVEVGQDGSTQTITLESRKSATATPAKTGMHF
jgi:hypothetical protein